MCKNNTHGNLSNQEIGSVFWYFCFVKCLMKYWDFVLDVRNQNGYRSGSNTRILCSVFGSDHEFILLSKRYYVIQDRIELKIFRFNSRYFFRSPGLLQYVCVPCWHRSKMADHLAKNKEPSRLFLHLRRSLLLGRPELHLYLRSQKIRRGRQRIPDSCH